MTGEALLFNVDTNKQVIAKLILIRQQLRMLNEALLNVLVEVNSSIVGLLPLAQTSECELVGDTDSLTPKEVLP